MLQKDYKEKMLEEIIELLWIQWGGLGLSSNINKKNKYCADIEPLIAFSMNIARYEPRLFDEILDWIDENERIINIQRLSNIVKGESFKSEGVLNAIGDFMSKRHKGIKWRRFLKKTIGIQTESLFIKRDNVPYPNYGRTDEVFERNGYYRGDVKFRGAYKGRMSDISRMSIQVKMRLFFGVNTRADIGTYMILGERVHPSELARKLYYSQKSVQDVLTEMHKSGLIIQVKKGKEKLYYADKNRWQDFFGSDEMCKQWLNWSKIYKALEIALEFFKGVNNDYGSEFIEYQGRIKSEEFKTSIDTSDIKIDLNCNKKKEETASENLINFVERVLKELKIP